MSATTLVQLVGGPFDGDEARIEDPLPPKIWVVGCKSCGTHWWHEWVNGGEVYNRDGESFLENSVRYVYADIDTSPSITEETRELAAA